MAANEAEVGETRVRQTLWSLALFSRRWLDGRPSRLHWPIAARAADSAPFRGQSPAESYRVVPSFTVATSFPRILPSFTEFYRVLPSFRTPCHAVPPWTGFYRVLLGFTEILLGFTEFYWVLPSFTGFYRVFVGLAMLCRLGLGFTEFYWVLPSFRRSCHAVPSWTGFYRVLLGFTEFHCF